MILPWLHMEVNTFSCEFSNSFMCRQIMAETTDMARPWLTAPTHDPVRAGCHGWAEFLQAATTFAVAQQAGHLVGLPSMGTIYVMPTLDAVGHTRLTMTRYFEPSSMTKSNPAWSVNAGALFHEDPRPFRGLPGHHSRRWWGSEETNLAR